MSTKYKYGENGSYFDPETKRTYYKDPQYQKAYDDEWNRLEKFYKMKQEEQRKIEMANFQRVLAQADALTKSMQASGIVPTPQPWEQKNRFDGTKNSEIERTSKREDREIQYVNAGYDEEGNQQVVRIDKATGHQLIIDPATGEMTDGENITGGSEYITPEIIVTPSHYHSPYGYSSANDWDQLKVLMQAGTDVIKELTPQPVKDKVKDAMASPIVQKTIGSPTVQAALPYLNALSPAAWMDTLYDAMYTPNEINYPWDEGNEGLGSPGLNLLFDTATTFVPAGKAVKEGLSKASNYGKQVATRIKELNEPVFDTPYKYYWDSHRQGKDLIPPQFNMVKKTQSIQLR